MSQSLAELSKGALSDLEGVFAAMPEDPLDGLVEAIVEARRIVVFGLGREGLQMRGFAMRGDALLLVTVLACFLGGVDPFGGFGRVAPVFVSLLILQTLSSGLNLIGANQHLSTAVWGLFLIAVMVFRSSTPTLRALLASVRK